MYHNGCYLRLFVFKVHMNNSSFFGISSFKLYPLITPPLKASRLSKRRGGGGCLSEEVKYL